MESLLFFISKINNQLKKLFAISISATKIESGSTKKTRQPSNVKRASSQKKVSVQSHLKYY